MADTFLYQIVDTAYFHCDPHPGNLAVDTSGNLVYYDFGMMDELSPNVKAGFKEFCFALFEGGPMIDDIQLGVKAKQLVDAVETAGVLAKGADRLSSEQLARYFIRAFKDKQLGKDRSDGPGIKSTLGTELQSLTESQVFRFPSTFTYIFRAIASIDGIGKGLDEDYDLGEFAQPFVTKLIDKVKYGGDNSKKSLAVFGKATGLNAEDVNTALTQPRKIAYLEETMRSIEQGQLKIRVRSLENEMALTRLGTQSSGMTNLLLSSLVLNVASVAKLARIPQLGLFGMGLLVLRLSSLHLHRRWTRRRRRRVVTLLPDYTHIFCSGGVYIRGRWCAKGGETLASLSSGPREQRLHNSTFRGTTIVTVLSVGGVGVPIPEILVCHCCASSQKVSCRFCAW